MWRSRSTIRDALAWRPKCRTIYVFSLWKGGRAEAIKNAKMDPRHDHLSALLEDDFGRRLLAQKGSIPPDVYLEI
jgi:hypothetical protein